MNTIDSDKRQVDELVRGYQDVASVHALTDRFKIHRGTVARPLHRANVVMDRRGRLGQQVGIAVRPHRRPSTFESVRESEGLVQSDLNSAHGPG